MTEQLTMLDPDPARAARVRARCHAQLACQRRRQDRRIAAVPIEATLACGLALLYLAAMTANVLRVLITF